MRVPIEPIYVNQDFNNTSPLEGGVSQIVHIPTSTPIISQPATTNEYGQTVDNQYTPTPINTPSPTDTGLLNEIVDSIKEVVANQTPSTTTTSSSGTTNGTTSGTTSGTKTGTTSGTSNKPVDNLIKDLKAIQSVNTTPKKPKTNYFLYGLIGVGALIVLMGVFKKK